MATPEEIRRAREQSSIFRNLFDYVRANEAQLALEGRRPVLGGLLSKEPVMGTDTIRYEGLGPMLAGLLSPIARGVDAPRAAAQGLIPQEDMVGEAFGTAGTAMLGGGAVAKPSGALGANTVRTKAEELRRQANIQRFGYDPNEVQEVDTSYRGSHQPVGPQDENPIRLDDVTKSITGEEAGYPDDFYSSQGMRLYAQPPSFPGDEYGIANQQSYRAIQAVRGNPDAEVTIYRGVPDSDDITTINPGDFVTLSPKYAELHAASGYGPRGDEAGKVISQRVKVRDVYFAGDDVNEFGYFPTDVAANASKNTGAMTLWHGSPYDFNEFDLSKIGTGEGAQDLGRGFSLTDYEANAHLYTNPASRWGDLAAMERYRQAGPGRYYQVNVGAAPEQFLDWSKPWRDQVPEGTPLYDALAKEEAVMLSQYADDPAMQAAIPRGKVSNMWRDNSGLEDAALQSGFVGNSRRNYSGDTEYTVFDPSLLRIDQKFDADGNVVSANASKPIGLLVLEQQARGNKDLGDLFKGQGMNIDDLSAADPMAVQGVLDMAQKRGILDPRSVFSLKRGLLD